jgi:hypothetical protein
MHFFAPILLFAISLEATTPSEDVFDAVHSANVLCLMRRKYHDYFFIIEVKRGCNK